MTKQKQAVVIVYACSVRRVIGIGLSECAKVKIMSNTFAKSLENTCGT